MEQLAIMAGNDPLNDRYIVGAIAALKDIRDADLEGDSL